ncbi:MAG: hypothetical protein ACD_2C00243G0002 [uncultured bacterium (gcode 4)]|uniref:CARDB domain-containing protein n=1 Tax=uncultured bacterium (gcode 4) TaxID=1234023 RepID=K2G1G1_9BACT|nr:MAG: hypothetical protein ACD_2C00243G0002 [uncultured bacterium (gcode 4)]
MKKYFLPILAFLLISPQAFAGPFDILHRNGNYHEPYYNPPLYNYDTSYNYIPLNYGWSYLPSNYYNLKAWDLSINDVNYYDSTTVSYNWNSRVAYNSIVVNICNYWNDLYYNGSVRAKIEVAWKPSFIYMNPFWSWTRWQCRKIWTSISNFNINYSGTYWVSVTVDDTSLLSESNRSNNYMYKSIYIPYIGTGFNNGSNWYSCNWTWYSYSNNVDWYTCNGIWYNRTNYNNSSTTYYCNNAWYTYPTNATWYYCNGTWYNRNNYNNNNGNYDSYYCNGTWYNYTSNATWYFCNQVWYDRYDDYNYNNSNSSSRSYYCNWSWLISDYSDRYFCNWMYYYFNSDNNYNNSNNYNYNGTNSNNTTSSLSNVRVTDIKVDNLNKRINAVICNNWTSQVKTTWNLRFSSNNSWRSSSVSVNLDLAAWWCTDLYSYATFWELWIYSSWNYSISARLNSAGSWGDFVRSVWINY